MLFADHPDGDSETKYVQGLDCMEAQAFWVWRYLITVGLGAPQFFWSSASYDSLLASPLYTAFSIIDIPLQYNRHLWSATQRSRRLLLSLLLRLPQQFLRLVCPVKFGCGIDCRSQ